MPGIYLGCSSNFGQGGLGKHLEFVYRSARASGHQVNVYCHQAPESIGAIHVEAPKWNRGVRYTPLRWLPSMQVYWNGIQFDKEVCQLIPNRSIVYHSFPGFAEHSFTKVRNHGGITVLEAATTHVLDLYSAISEEHGKYGLNGSPFSKRWADKLLREYELADYVTVASSLQWESFVRHGVSPAKLLMAPLGVDTESFSPVYDQASFRPREKNEKFRIIQVGQVSLLKGFQYLLDAMERLGDPEIELTLFGGIGWRPIKSFIHSYMKRGVNIKLGAGNPIPALRNAHICVHPSINDGFGYAPLEAMSVGLPTIVTESTGMKDIIRHGVNGYIVPARNPDSLARHIAKLKTNETDRIALGIAARKTALQYDICSRTIKYAEILSPIWN